MPHNSFFKKPLKTSNCNYFFWFFWIASLTLCSALFTQGNLLFTGEAFLFFSLEAVLLAFLFRGLKKLTSKKPKIKIFLKIATSLLAFLFLIHLINLFLLVILDTNLNFLYTMLFQDQTSNFLVKMRAMSLSGIYFILTGLIFIGFPLLIYSFYLFSQRLAFKKPLMLSSKTLFLTLLGALLTLGSFDFLASRFSQNRLTDKLCFFSLFQSTSKDKAQDVQNMQNDTQLQTARNQNSLTLTSALNLKCSKKPPIFLFVIESFRYDAINSKATPCLQNFKTENLSFKHSYANANCTQLAWFSIFFSELPWHWTSPQKQGALPLKIFKQLGYKIKVLSSAELAYFNMKQKLFGKNLELTDSLEEFEAKESFQRDALAFQALKNQEISEGTLYIIFLDTPHNEYNHPQKNQTFKPTTNSLNYLRLALFPNQEALLLKNRYLNCVNYLDGLFKDFFESLKAKNLYQQAIIVITGDHGEEFYEKGAFFHGSRLSESQIKIPLIYKIPDLSALSDTPSSASSLFSPAPKKLSSYTSQIDIFPTILHVLTGQQIPFLEGSSIFSQKNPRSQKIISFNQNGGLDPVDFILRSPQKKTFHITKK